MAHWSDKHTKKDIVNFYEGELATLRADNERLREALKNIIDAESWIFSGDDLKDIAKEALK